MNCRDEFVNHVESKEVLCAEVVYKKDYDEKNDVRFDLKCGFSKEDYEEFLSLLNFDYDCGYGIQEIFGTIWYKDGTWSDRYEYDGSESWNFQKCPEIKDFLKVGA